MNTILKTFILCVITSFSIRVYTAETQDSIKISPIKKNKDGGHGDEEGNHFPHRAPTKEHPLPKIVFNPADKSLSFSSADNIHFLYKVYDSMESVVREGEVSIAKDGTERIFLPECAAGDYVIIIDLNGLLYRGEFKIEDVF